MKEASNLYDLELESVNKISEAENFVYEYENKKNKYILKITHTLRRSINYILGEIDWITFLESRGLNLSEPIKSINGKYIEEVECKRGDGSFLIRSYKKAPGKLVDNDDWNQELFYCIGKYMGKMHKLTKEYTVSNLKYKRQEWYEEEQLNLSKYIPKDQKGVLKKADELIGRLKKLPITKENYGLIHADMHHGNFHLDNNKIIAFDFDDVGYSWFINDISILLYNVLWYPVIPYDDKEEFTEIFMRSFLDGYFKENTLSKNWLEYIPEFLKLRQILIYGLFHQMLDTDKLSATDETMLNKMRFNIEHDVPVINFDFKNLYNQNAKNTNFKL
ncbi:phosphotransferase enzyme family protein [Staphylococcus intermedius]|uniref:phosphotransferase enzyme family protein n=1 Tax=Staphylococcus intermedius TaxID=1285 RepID=UPI001EE1E666|nr:phosphotransferase [Staphylococcus intermedius]